MPLTKAELTTESGDTIACLFNPSEISVSKSNSWDAGQSKGRNAPKLRFQGGDSATLTMSLTLDTTATGEDVSIHTAKLWGLMKVDGDMAGADRGRNAARPPWVEFHWGATHSFKAVLSQLQLRFTYFTSTGQPLRARAEMTLRQWDDEDALPLQNPTSHTEALHTVHRLLPGQTLDRVAARYYDDSSRWRLIAEHNQIVDPLRLDSGTLLVIPDLPVRSRG